MGKTKSYVYRCEHKISGKYYFGVRTANWLPAEQDLGIHYFTSSKVVQPNFHEYNYEILSEYSDPVLALKVEQNLIWNSRKDKNLINKECKSGGYQENFGNPRPTKKDLRNNHPDDYVKCPARNMWIDPALLSNVDYIKERIATTTSKKNLKIWSRILVKLL